MKIKSKSKTSKLSSECTVRMSHTELESRVTRTRDEGKESLEENSTTTEHSRWNVEQKEKPRTCTSTLRRSRTRCTNKDITNNQYEWTKLIEQTDV